MIKKRGWILGSFLILCVLCYYFPYTLDDWAWGSDVGIERLRTWFENYNGRYAGNLLVIVLTRSNLLKTIVIAGTIVTITYLIMKIINVYNYALYWLSLLLIFVMPLPIFSQTIAWTSGFTNYVIPMVGILIFFYVFKNVLCENYKFNKKLLLPMFLVGFISALFMENLTLYNIFISGVLLIYTKIVHKKVDSTQVSFGIGAILGAVYMFSNSSYRMVLSGADTYRSVSKEGNIILNAIKTYFDEIYPSFNFQYTWINIFLCLLLSIKAVKMLKENNKCFVRVFLGSIIFFVFAYGIYNLLMFLNPNLDVFKDYKKYVEGLLVIAFCICIFLITLLDIKSNIKMRIALLIEMSIVWITAPLFFVNPISPRCFFPVYIMFVMLVCAFYDDVMGERNKYYYVYLFIWILRIAMLFFVYNNISKANEERINYIQNKVAAGEKRVEVQRIKYSDYVWNFEPGSKMWKDHFKNYHDIPLEIEIEWADD